MKISEKDVDYVADLAHLALTAEERTRLIRDLDAILEYIDCLNEVDTKNVPPATLIAGTQDGTREDVLEGLRKSLAHDVALAGAPDADGTFFRVPKVIER